MILFLISPVLGFVNDIPSTYTDVYQGETVVFPSMAVACAAMGDGSPYGTWGTLAYPILLSTFPITSVSGTQVLKGKLDTYPTSMYGYGDYRTWVIPTVFETCQTANYYLANRMFCSNEHEGASVIWKVHAGTRPPITIIFSATEDGDYTKKLIDVDISLSNGMTGLTDINGNYTFVNVTASSGSRYTAIKTGYNPRRNISLDTTIGNNGGVVNFTMINLNTTPGNVSVYFDIRDGSSSALIQGASWGIQNLTNMEWRNATIETGKGYTDATGANRQYPLSLGTTVRMTAAKTGYQSATQDVLIPYDKYLVTLNLLPTNLAPSTGNFSAVVSINCILNGTPLKQASVSMSPGGKTGMTNDAGAAIFNNIAIGNYSLTASATGYQSAMTDISGISGQTIMKAIQLLPNGYTIGPGGAITDPTGTVVVPGAGTGTGSGTGSSDPNTKAAGGVTSFLDNIGAIGGFIIFLLLIWFVRKIW